MGSRACAYHRLTPMPLAVLGVAPRIARRYAQREAGIFDTK